MAITLQSGIRALLLAAALAIPSALPAQVGISVTFGPPSLPVYAQPVCPGDGYLWTPGYWAYGPEGYYWVPGAWVLPPRPGFLWTPAYWAYEGNAFYFHPGYWGPHIGFYGGINYGFGYGGVGYEGGYWRGNIFAYNRSVNNLGGSVHNIYDHPVELRNGAYNHVSYNGGRGGVPYRPSPPELAALREPHYRATGQQLQHQNFAAQDRQQFARYNNGRPALTAAGPNVYRGNPAATAREGFGGPNPNRPTFRQNYPQQQRMANGNAFPSQQRQQLYREPNNMGRQAYRQIPNSYPQSQRPPEFRQQQRSQQEFRQPQRQQEFRQPQQQRQQEFRQAAPRNEIRPAPAPRGGGGHEGRR